MSCGSHHTVILDACFLADLYKVDSSCGLMEDFCCCAGDASCLYVGSQFDTEHCGKPPAACRDLDAIFPPEEAIAAEEHATIDFTRVTSDPCDPQMIIWAHRQEGKAAIFSSDRNLLKVCAGLSIPRACFKAALHALDRWYGEGAIFQNEKYTTTEMFRTEGENLDPFFHYCKDSRCEKFCQLGERCPRVAGSFQEK